MKTGEQAIGSQTAPLAAGRLAGSGPPSAVAGARSRQTALRPFAGHESRLPQHL